MACLSRLPIELILSIADYLPKQRDISSFMRTNRKLYHVLHPFLCRFNSRHREGSAFVFAAKHGCTDLVNKLFNAGASVGSVKLRDPEDCLLEEFGSIINPLLVAAQSGHAETLQALLKDSQSDRACTLVQLRSALHWALRSRDTEVFQMLIAKNAPLSLPSPDDYEYNPCVRRDTALGVAIASGCSNDLVKHLLRQGAEIDEKENPYPWYEATVQRGGEMLQLLLNHGRWPKSDRILCELALRSNDPSVLETFTDVEKGGIDVRVYGHTALFTAVEKGHIDMVKYLIERGANPNLTCSYKNWGGLYNITWMAVQARHFEILEYLITKQGVRPDQDALEKAREMEFEQAVSLLSTCSYEDIPAKTTIAAYISMLERKVKKPSPEFHAVEWLPCMCPVSESRYIPFIKLYLSPREQLGLE
ncbi:ankyrin repeat-containing domain protein [Aspergillus californicus]